MLALLFERDEIGNANATVTADAMRHNLTSIEKLVQMRATHAQSLSSLRRGQR